MTYKDIDWCSPLFGLVIALVLSGLMAFALWYNQPTIRELKYEYVGTANGAEIYRVCLDGVGYYAVRHNSYTALTPVMIPGGGLSPCLENSAP